MAYNEKENTRSLSQCGKKKKSEKNNSELIRYNLWFLVHTILSLLESKRLTISIYYQSKKIKKKNSLDGICVSFPSLLTFIFYFDQIVYYIKYSTTFNILSLYIVQIRIFNLWILNYIFLYLWWYIEIIRFKLKLLNFIKFVAKEMAP